MKEETKLFAIFSSLFFIEIMWWIIVSDFWWEPVRCATVEFDMIKHTIRTLILFIPLEIFLLISAFYLVYHLKQG